MKHTPGPWVYEPGPQGDPDVEDADFIVAEQRVAGDVLATVSGPVRTGTTEGNARLMAAPPELLGMLRRLAAAAQRYPDLAPLAAECALAVCKAEGTTEFAEQLAAQAEAVDL